MSCNLIFWSVVMPILTLVSEIWILSDKDHEIIQNFRRYSRRRVQRFPQIKVTKYHKLFWSQVDWIHHLHYDRESTFYKKYFLDHNEGGEFNPPETKIACDIWWPSQQTQNIFKIFLKGLKKKNVRNIHNKHE